MDLSKAVSNKKVCLSEISLLPILGNTIKDFKSAILLIGGAVDATQQILRQDSFATKIVTKPKELMNTKSEKCVLIPLDKLSKVL